MSTSHDESTLGSPFEADEPEPCGDTSNLPPCEECGAKAGESCRPWCINDLAYDCGLADDEGE